MAEFLWTFSVQEVLKKVVKLAAEQIDLAWGLEKELSKLSKWLLKAETVLRDIDRKKLHHDSVRLWVEDLQHVVHEADDLLDELAYEDLRRKVEKRKWRSPLGLIGEESIEIETDLSQIRETISELDEFKVVGREIEVSGIVKQVVDASNQQVMSIIPIVGMGGLGKTTLAKLIFNHELIKRHFDETIWVCVSEPFLINKILEAILQTLRGAFSGLDNKEVLIRELQKEMQGKRYFLVLDDVWNEHPSLWNELKYCFLRITEKSGNSIIVTTRSVEIAEIMGTLPIHHLKKLSNHQCWSLFKESANANGQPMTPELEVIQDELVKKFGGVPLVARVLGGAVKFQGNYERWITTLEGMVRIPLQDEDFVLSILKLSVDCLPSSLKQCFAYCSNFPKDFHFQKEQLIQLWMAQGFIQSREDKCNVMMEDIGDKYFNILLSRSLFQDVVKDERGRILHCKMHDLMHDIACAISNPQKLQNNPINLLDKEFCINCSEKGVRKLRTLILEGFHHTEMAFHDKVVNCICLRVLIVGWGFVENLSNSIGKLKHLRYLDITYSSIRELPRSIIMLYNLQTLRIGDSCKVPNNLRKLVSLRYFQFPVNSLNRMKQMPPHLGQMIQLQTLSGFIGGVKEGCKIEELGPLKNLKGRVKVTHLEQVKSKEEALAAPLVEKENVCELFLEWWWFCKQEGSNYNNLEVLEGLQPHKNLQLLCIRSFAGECFPNSIFVKNLVEIYLQNCERCEMLPILGQLPSLETLVICGLPGVRSIGNEFYGNDSNQKAIFPHLKTFELSKMDNLEQWEEVAAGSNGTIFFPRLEDLGIKHCPKLMSIPNLFGSPDERLELDEGTINLKSFPSIQGVGKLRFLCIWECGELTQLPDGLEFCISIEILEIIDCPNMTLNLQNMHNLSYLGIRDLQKLPEGLSYLTNLKELVIRGCMENYDLSPLLHLPSLIKLQLTDYLRSAVTQLPQQVEHLTALRSLSIWNFDAIEALPEWLGNLTSLEELDLHMCINLKNLPSRDAMLRLTKLNLLNVSQCPQLQLGEGHPEWAKVSHVPTMSVSD